MALLEVKDLTVSYLGNDGQAAPTVKAVSFGVEKGATLGIVGASGCGKTTIARALLGYNRPGSKILSGAVWFEGENILDFSALKLRELRGRRIAMVPQNPLNSLTFHMKVGPQVDEILQMHRGMDAKQARLQTLELFAATNLPEPEQIYSRFPHEISGGQRQRVVIAGALACRPKLMVLDEPTTALDTTTEMRVLKLVKELREKFGMALVYITHDLTLTNYMCENVLVMLDGKVVERGTASRIFDDPQEAYTRMLVSSIPRIDAKPGLSIPPAKKNFSTLLRVERLCFRYPKKWSLAALIGSRDTPLVVEEVSFDLRAGETIGLVGESGSGKSTIANILCGLLVPTTGELVFDGQSIGVSDKKRSLDLRRRIQMIFQDPLSSLNPRQRIETILTRPLAIFFGLKGKAARDRAVELLEEVDLPPGLLRRFPRQLSGGQQQRVAIARAFAAEPELILCDEITSALDVSVQARVLELLKRIQIKHGAACVFISHDLGAINLVAENTIVLENGRMVETGTTARIFSAPTQQYTRLLLAAAARREAYAEPTGT